MQTLPLNYNWKLVITYQETHSFLKKLQSLPEMESWWQYAELVQGLGPAHGT